MRLALAVAAVLLLASPAPACLNDAFTKDEEREFRARYASERSGTRIELATGSVGVLGAAVVAGCVTAAVRRLRSR